MSSKNVIDPTANPDAPKLDENGNPILDAPVVSVISEEVMQDMKNIWTVCDTEGKNQVTIDELKTIMRALDVNVQQELAMIQIKEMIDPDKTGFITFERLTIVMEDKLKETDTLEDLVAQLKKLDKRGEGKIPAPEFKQYMMNMGSKMTAEELEEMMKVADPSKDGVVDIMDFADALCPPKK